MMNQDP